MKNSTKHSILSPGRLINEADAQELKAALYSPKVGGKAILPTSCQVQDGHIVCSICSNYMSFVASVCVCSR